MVWWILIGLFCLIAIVFVINKKKEHFELTCEVIEVEGPSPACGEKGMISELSTTPVKHDDGSYTFKSTQKCCMPGSSDKICIGNLCIYESGLRKIMKANGLLSMPASSSAAALLSSSATMT